MKNNRVAVILGMSPTGLSIARSLERHGVTVYGIDSIWYEIGHFSSVICHDRCISKLPPGKELLDGLVSFGKKCFAKPVIFIATDLYIDFIAAYRAQLEPFYIMPESMRPEINSIFVNKRTFYEACRNISVVMPKTYFPITEGEVKTVAASIHYPAILKPSYGAKLRHVMRGKKIIQVANSEELLQGWRIFQQWKADVILQECIPGPEQNLAVGGLYMDRYGECRSLFTAKKYRQQPPMYGSGSYMEAKWLPDIAELSVDLMKRLHYHGICGTEYKWDERDRQWKLIEVNVRPTLWFALTRAAGVDVVWDAYCDLIGFPNPVHCGQQDDKIRWQFFVRDISSALYFLGKGELSWAEFFRTTIDQRRKASAVCEWNDWGANFGYMIYTAMQIRDKYFS